MARGPSGIPWPALGIFVFALAIRLLHVWQLRSAPLSSLLMGDALSYDAWARNIAAGDWVGRDVFYQAPLYPYVLGALYAVIGRSVEGVRVCQAVLGAGACALLAGAGTRMFEPRSGIAAGLILALYAPAIFFDALIQKSVLDVLLLSSLLLLVSLLMAGVTLKRSLLAGVVLGCLALTRENTLVLLPVFLLWLWLRARRALAPVFALIVGVSVLLAPVALRNVAVGGEFHLTTSQFGPNLYIGNHEHATGSYVPLRSGHGSAADERKDATALAEQALGRPLGPAEVSSYWTRRAVAWIADHPLGWMRLMTKKFFLVWNAREAVDTEDLDTYAGWSWPLRASNTLFHFGILAPLGIIGIWLSRGRWRDLWIVYAMIAAYTIGVALFYVLARYRYPLVPLLALFAGVALVNLRAWWSRCGPFERVGVFVLAGGALVACNWPVLSTEAMRATTHYNLGSALQEAGRTEEAIREYRVALELQPANAGAHTNLGVLLAAQGEHEEALRHYQEALRIDPGTAAAHTNLGIELAARNRVMEAIDHFRRALDLDSRDAVAHYNLGTALAAIGDPDPAIHHFTETIRLDPTHADAHNNFGILLAQGGRLHEAIEQFRLALRLRPGFAAAQANLGRAQTLAREQ